MRTTLFFILGMVGFLRASGQAPNWQVNPAQYDFSMVMVGLIKVDGVTTSNPDDKIAAFINGEVRGVASPIYQEQVDRNLFYLIVYNNEDAGNVTFKYFNAATQSITSAVQSATFLVDGLLGDVNKPAVWSDRVLKKEAAILNYTLPEQLGSRVYSDSIVVRLNPGSNLSAMAHNFSVSEGAMLYIENEPQVSGVTENDFSKPLTLIVRSEDEQVIKQYTLTIRNEKDAIPNVLFPNGNEQNKTWGLAHLGITEPVRISVFDQNGKVVFSTTSSEQEWDGRHNGKQVSEGIYFYSIEREDGSKYQGPIHVIY